MKRSRSIPTRAGWTALGGALVLVVAGIVFGLTESLAAAAGLAAVLLGSLVRVALWTPSVSVSRSVVPARVQVGQRCTMELRVTAVSKHRTRAIELSDRVESIGTATLAVPPLDPGNTIRATYSFPTDRRGCFEVGPARAEPIDPFNLVRRHALVAEAMTVVVWPASWIIQLPERTTEHLDATGPQLRARRSESGEFATLAEYRPGDDTRLIHWPSTARVGRPVVARFEPPAPGSAWILLDTSIISTSAFERAVSLCATVVRSALAAGEIVRVMIPEWSDDTTSFTELGAAGITELPTILDHLGGLEQTAPLPESPLPESPLPKSLLPESPLPEFLLQQWRLDILDSELSGAGGGLLLAVLADATSPMALGSREAALIDGRSRNDLLMVTESALSELETFDDVTAEQLLFDSVLRFRPSGTLING